MEAPQGLTVIDSPQYRDGDIARKFFGLLPMMDQLKWALMMKRLKHQMQFRGVLPRNTGRRAQARAAGFPNHAAYARHVHQQQLKAQQEAEKAAADRGDYAPKPAALAVNGAFN